MLKLENCDLASISAGAIFEDTRIIKKPTKAGKTVKTKIKGYTVCPNWMANKAYKNYLHGSYIDGVIFVLEKAQAIFLDELLNANPYK